MAVRTRLFLAATILASAAVSQQQFREFEGRALDPAVALTRAAEVGDVDGDGDLDLFLSAGGDFSIRGRILLNDGTGAFEPGMVFAFPSLPGVTDAAFLDLEGDGDLDLVIAPGSVAPPYLMVWTNDGTGQFTDASTTALSAGPTSRVEGLAIGDIDADGDTDLVAVGDNQMLLRNSAGLLVGVPAGSDWPASTTNSRDAAFADLDGDNDLDVVIASTGVFSSSFSAGANRIYLNDGTGSFTQSPSPLAGAPRSTQAVGVGDFDGDQDLDLFFTNRTIGATMGTPPISGQDRLYLNDGSGVFTDATARIPTEFNDPRSLVVFDFEDDGDLDIVIAGAFPAANPFPFPFTQGVRVLENDGSGQFADGQDLLTDSLTIVSIGIGDLDADGDPDLVLGRDTATPTPDRILFNLRRHTAAPATIALGSAYSLDVFARGPLVGVSDAALPLVALGPAPFPLPLPPFGILGLDPVTLTPLPVVAIDPASRQGSLTLPVPSNPAVVGVELFVQSLLVEVPPSTPASIRLTNVFSYVIGP